MRHMLLYKQKQQAQELGKLKFRCAKQVHQIWREIKDGEKRKVTHFGEVAHTMGAW